MISRRRRKYNNKNKSKKRKRRIINKNKNWDKYNLPIVLRLHKYKQMQNNP